MYMCVYVCVDIYVCVYIYICTHKHTYTHIFDTFRNKKMETKKPEYMSFGLNFNHFYLSITSFSKYLWKNKATPIQVHVKIEIYIF